MIKNIDTSSSDLKNYKSSYTVLPNNKTVVDSTGHASAGNTPNNVVHLAVPVDEDDELHIHRKSKSLGDANGISEEIITIHGLNKTVIVQDEYSQSYGSTSSDGSYQSNEEGDNETNIDTTDLESQSAPRGKNSRRGSMTSIKSWISTESKGRTRSRSRSKARTSTSGKKSSKKGGKIFNLKYNSDKSDSGTVAKNNGESLSLNKVQPRNEPQFSEYLKKSLSKENVDDTDFSSQVKPDGDVVVDSAYSSHDNVVSDPDDNEDQVIKWGKDRREEDD